jgi:hypothetical protein
MKPLLSLLTILALATSLHAEKIVEVVGEGLKEPFGTEFDSKGTMYVVEMVSGNRLFRVEEDGKLIHIAGQEKAGYSGDGGPALQAQFNGPHNLAVLPDGNILIGDTWNGVVRKVNLQTSTVSTLPGFKATGKNIKGTGPYCITLDFTGTKLYIANLQQVHVVELASGTCSVVAGNGKKGRPEDGTIATEAPLVDPRAVAVDRQGQIYILERGGNALRVVGTDGKIRTVVNASGKKGGDGDGGPALDATMDGPKHLCVDKDDTVIIADAESHLQHDLVESRRLLSFAISAAINNVENEELELAAAFASRLEMSDLALEAYQGLLKAVPARKNSFLQKIRNLAILTSNTRILLDATRQLAELNPSNPVYADEHSYFRLLLGQDMETVDLPALKRQPDILSGQASMEGRVSISLLEAMAAFRFGDQKALSRHVSRIPATDGMTAGHRAVLSGLLATTGKPAEAFQIAEKVPEALLLDEERAFLKLAR